MIKTILVPINQENGMRERLDFSIQMANKFDAHIKALQIILPLEDTVSRSLYSTPALIADVYNNVKKHREKETSSVRKKYEKILKKSGVLYDWCKERGDSVELLYLHARAADLTIINQENDDLADIMGSTNDFIIGSGLPVIAIPTDGAKDFSGKNILVAWDGGKECAKATHAALPFLRLADKVTVVTISEEKKMEVPEAEICVHLARHGVNAEALTVSDNVPVGKRLLDTAESTDADLIVAGAWGHQRLKELIFGGVTRKLISNQKKVVFLAH